MKKLGHFKYTSLFLSHVEGFLLSFLGRDYLKQDHLISVSGGVDSMALLYVAMRLCEEKKIGPIRALFIHHQTRMGQDNEQKLVESFCRKHGVPFLYDSLQGLKEVKGNFEEEARLGRKFISQKFLKKNEWLWQGHHLDDSYEWHLMQKSKSHELTSTLGIPVRNKKIVRPFLCVTKDQIRRLVAFEKIPYLEDPTNVDEKFERNYLRHQVIPLIKKRYPHYLKMYASQQNDLSKLLKLSVFPQIEVRKIHFESGDLFLSELVPKNIMIQSVREFSEKHRGELSQAVDRALKAIQNKKKGPFYFSGNVQAYASGGCLMITSKHFKNADEALARFFLKQSEKDFLDRGPHTYETLSASFERVLNSKNALEFMPFLALIFEPQSTQRNFNSSVYDSMFPCVSEICQKRGWRFVYVPKALYMWKKKQKRLSEKLGIYPLYELSYLFSFQE
jgi:tRNA(Ile)-lysidine synthase